MKRFKHGWMLWPSILAVLCLLMSPVHAEEVLEAQASSEQYTSGDYTYSYVSSSLYPDLEGTIRIDSYNGNDDVLWIPDTLDGKTVTALGPGAFSKKIIDAVFIPKTIQLAPINLINGQVTSAFSECYLIGTIVFEEGMIKVPSQICWSCTDLSEIYIPNTVTEIGENAFRNCGMDFIDVYIAPSVTTIPENAFAGCPKDLEIYGVEGSYAETYALDVFNHFGVLESWPSTSIQLSLSNLNLSAGSSQTLKASVLPSNFIQDVNWSSSNTSVATVSGGKVTAVSEGTARITAKSIYGKTASCKVTVTKATASASGSTDTQPIYRLYMPSTGEHLYTSDKNEYDTLYKKYGWGQEGIGWYAPSSGTAVYRLYQPGLKNHLYTTDKNEVQVLTSKYGWVTDNGGEALYYSGGSVPIYRVYNKGLNGMHHLTTDSNEYNTLPKFGWQQEGATLYATKIGSPFTTTKYYK